MKTSMQSTNKPRPPVPSSMDVCDLGGVSGPPRLHTGGAKNLWVKKNHLAPTTSHSDEEADNFHNTIDKILEKQTHYTIVMGDFNAKVGGQTNTSERAT